MGSAAASSRSTWARGVSALVEAARPRQWTKNLFVFAGLVFTDNWPLLPRVLLVFAAYCLMSSGVYLLNDVRDREADALHPEKCRRPIPRGDLSPGVATMTGLLACVAGWAMAALPGLPSALVAAAFLILQAAYTFHLKTLVLLDVFTIAAAFVLRVFAGAVAISVPVSEWLLVCTLLLALFLGFGKRRSELLQLTENAGQHRRSLDHYSVPFLDQLISIVLGALIVAYAVYSASSPTAKSHPGMIGTLPFVVYGVFRYLYLVQMKRMGGSPETILLQDRPLQIALLLWFAAVLVAFRLA